MTLATFSSKPEISLIEIGSLELTTIPLHKNIEKYARFMHKLGCNHLKILPLFLAPGVHVCEDIPAEIAKVESILAEKVTIKLLPYLGKYKQTLALLNKQYSQLPTNGKILLAHGTSYSRGNVWLKNLAHQLDARIAYYSVAASLPAQIEELISKGVQKIAIVPYLLFPGKISDAIAARVKQLQKVFPETELILGEPLGTKKELANLLVEVLTK